MDAIAPNLPASFSQRNPFYCPSQNVQKGVQRSREVSHRGSGRPDMTRKCLEHYYLPVEHNCRGQGPWSVGMTCAQIILRSPHPGPPSVAFWNGWADGRLWCPFSLARFFLAPKTLSLGHLELLSLVTTEPLTVFKHVH